MYIEKINITSFGGIKDFSAVLHHDVNIFEGDNESGKTTIAEFIKFMFYGIQQKQIPGKTLTERKRYFGWNENTAQGSMTVADDGGRRILIERSLVAGGDESTGVVYKESVKMTDADTGETVGKGQIPGEFILGVPEEIYVSTAFVRQIGGAGVDGERLSSASENLLFSADEEINTEKAIERLDHQRRSLLYKNGKGGSIYDKEKAIGELSVRLENARRSSGELIDTESMISDLKEKRDSATEKRDITRDKAEKFTLVSDLHRYDEIHAIDEKLTSLYSEKDSLLASGLVRGHFPDEDFISELRAVCDGMAATSSAIAMATRQLEGIKNEIGDESEIEKFSKLTDDENESESIVKTAEKTAGKRLALTIISSLLLVSALVLGGFSYIITDMRDEAGTMPMVLAAASVLFGIVSVVMFFMAAALSRAYTRMLSTYDVSSVDMLPERLEEIRENTKEKRRLAERREVLETELYVKYTSYDDQKKHASELLALRGVEADDDDIAETMATVLADCSSICERDRVISGDIEKCKNAEAVIKKLIASDDEKTVREKTAGLDISAYDSLDPQRLKIEYEFNEKAVIRLTERLHELEIRRTELMSSRDDPSGVMAKIDSVTRECTAERDRYRSLVMAMEALTDAGKNVRGSIAPRIKKYAEEYLGRITNGKYSSIMLDSAFSMAVDADGSYRDIGYLSEGTCDAAYLSLRLALIKVLYRNGTPPLVFDEAFARMDDGRTLAALSVFCDGGTDYMPQTLIFTCQKREGELLGASLKDGFYHIKLNN